MHGGFTKSPEELGAGDQGHMFGYATDETPELMPLTHSLATQLGKKLTDVRKDGTLAWVRPDGKTQVGLCRCVAGVRLRESDQISPTLSSKNKL